jgi:hypothetical protein
MIKIHLLEELYDIFILYPYLKDIYLKFLVNTISL